MNDFVTSQKQKKRRIWMSSGWSWHCESNCGITKTGVWRKSKYFWYCDITIAGRLHGTNDSFCDITKSAYEHQWRDIAMTSTNDTTNDDIVSDVVTSRKHSRQKAMTPMTDQNVSVFVISRKHPRAGKPRIIKNFLLKVRFLQVRLWVKKVRLWVAHSTGATAFCTVNTINWSTTLLLAS